MSSAAPISNPPHVLSAIDHRPYAMPQGRWRMSQRWNDLLFAHWPIPLDQMERLVPPSLQVDTHDGFAWAGVVPFWMDRVRTRAIGDPTLTVPGTGIFAELNLRTYVRSRLTGLPGVFFFSLDAASLLAVIGARTLFGLPYYWAAMRRAAIEEPTAPDQSTPRRTIEYESRRRLTRESVRFSALYRSLGSAPHAARSLPGSLEYFLTERYCLFTASKGRVSVGHIHHLPWPLEPAEADIRLNELPTAHGIVLPNRAPVLHFAGELEVYIWSLKNDQLQQPLA